MPAGPENSGYLLFLSYQTYQSNSKHAILKHRFHSLPQLPRSSLQPAVSGALGHWAHWMRTGQPGALVNMNQKTNRMVYVGICWNMLECSATTLGWDYLLLTNISLFFWCCISNTQHLVQKSRMGSMGPWPVLLIPLGKKWGDLIRDLAKSENLKLIITH